MTMGNLKDYYHTNSFFSLLKDTKKYRELYCSKEAVWSFGLSIVFASIIMFLYDSMPNDRMREILQNVLFMLIPGLIGLLGFLITGLAMTASIIELKVIQEIDKSGKIRSLVEILFSFYFEAAMIGVNIVSFLLLYFMVYCPFKMSFVTLIVLALAYTYFFFFTIIYAVTLLGTCLNFFLVNVFYSERSE